MPEVVVNAQWPQVPGVKPWPVNLSVEIDRPQFLQAWRSNGGPARLHPARAYPLTLSLEVPAGHGVLQGVRMIGVFARYAEAKHEPHGALGAALSVIDGEGNTLARRELVNGRHYHDCCDLVAVERRNGDGTSVRTVGTVQTEDGPCRLDMIEFDLEEAIGAKQVILRDLGTPASFEILSAQFIFEQRAVCPFKGHEGQVSLVEIASIVRMRDRGRFRTALEQVQQGILACHDDMDEARGTALTFLAVVSTGLLESGGSREIHRFQLEAAKKLMAAKNLEMISELTAQLTSFLIEPVMPADGNPNDLLIRKSIMLMEKSFGQAITDEEIASRIGLSTSHFRHLFKEYTGQPFHRYLMSLRLERARDILAAGSVPVSQVSKSVGFASAAHFSRAFQGRFGVSPSNFRKTHLNPGEGTS
ncbi:MAG: helix-turn-helix transcriptional regulator [Armatimonadetes bacterium]|nr:helix-turn-helix transcriptional regulator [Armatimonadota bacterium]